MNRLANLSSSAPEQSAEKDDPSKPSQDPIISLHMSDSPAGAHLLYELPPHLFDSRLCQ